MEDVQYSLGFITPITEIKINIYSYLKNTYLKSELHDFDYGERFFMLFDLNTPIEMIKEIEKSPIFDSIEFLDEGVLVIFKPTEYQITNIINPFMVGKYSKICRDYVEKNFNTGDPNYVNYMILKKSKYLKEYWEDRINVTLPEDAEVWSKPDLKKEIFNPKYGEVTAC